MKSTSKLFSVLIMLSLVMGLTAAPAFGNGAAVLAQGEQTKPSAATAQPVAPLLQADAAAVIPDQYIVVYKAGADSPAYVRGGADRMTAMGGKVGHIYSAALHGFSARLSAEALQALREDPNVEYIEPDQTVSLNDDIGVETTQAGATWGLDRIDQHTLPLDTNYNYLYDGTGVNVYVIDTGIRTTHTEFGGRASMDADEVETSGPNYMIDCNGHGTHVSGTIGGNTYGVAKQVSLHGIKVLDCSGHGSNSGVIAGIDWVTTNHVSPAVANMSLGGGASSALDTAVNHSIAAGVTYVIAAGNGDANGIGLDACLVSPARVPKAITVAATNSADKRASFSNFGTCVDIFAPGVSITSAWNTGDSDTNTIPGTSMASPHVAGAAALYLQGHPGATPASVAAGLTSSATSGVVVNAGTGSPNRLLYILSTAAPKLVSPLNKAFTNDPQPNLSWDPAFNGDTYQAQIATAYTFGGTVVEDSGPIGVLNYTPSSLADHKYYWHVRGINVSNQPGPWSAYRAFTVDTTPPLAPVLSAPGDGATVLGTPAFTWLAATGANAYRFEYALDDSFSSSSYTSGVLTTTTFTPPTIPVGVYYWHVQSRDAAGNWSAAWSGERMVTINPPIPAKVSLTTPLNKEFTNNALPTLNWNGVPYGETYLVQIATAYTFGGTVVWDSGQIAGLSTPPGTSLADGKYYWHVRSYNIDNQPGPWSAYRAFTVDTVLPDVPVLSTPSGVVNGTPAFTWFAAAGASAYVFEYDDDSLFGSPNHTSLEVTGTSYTPPLMSLGTFYWHVKARDAAGNWSTWNDPAFTVVVHAPLPAKPTLVTPRTGAELADLTPTLTWNSVAYAVNYEVQVDNQSSFASPDYNYTGLVTTSKDTDLLTARKWYWRVRARNVDGDAGAWSASRYFTGYFDSQFNSDSTGWARVSGAAWSVNSSEYSTAGANNYYSSTARYAGVKYSNFTYQAQMRMDYNYGGWPNYLNDYGLIVRGTPTVDAYGDWINGYYFLLGQVYDSWYGTNVACFTAYKITNATWTSLNGGYYSCWAPAYESSPINFNNWNLIKVTAKGIALKFYVNNHLLLSTSGSDFLTGEAGFVTWRTPFAETTHVDWATMGPPPGTAVLSAEQVVVPTIMLKAGPKGQLYENRTRR